MIALTLIQCALPASIPAAAPKWAAIAHLTLPVRETPGFTQELPAKLNQALVAASSQALRPHPMCVHILPSEIQMKPLRRTALVVVSLLVVAGLIAYLGLDRILKST